MSKKETYEFQVNMTAKSLWDFSLYHANKGYLGLFNVFFTLASLFLLVTTWTERTTAQRILLIFCASMFTVLQPGQLYLKAKKQASLEAMKKPIFFVFTKEGVTVEQAGQMQELAWNQIVRVEGTKKQIVVYMDRVRAFLVTNEAMGDQREEFCQMLKEVLPKERRKRI